MTDDGAPIEVIPVPVALMMDVKISGSAKHLWSVLWLFGATGGSMTFEIKVEQIMELMGGSKPSVIKWRRELVEAGWLEESAWRGVAQKNVYTVKTIQSSDSPAEPPLPR